MGSVEYTALKDPSSLLSKQGDYIHSICIFLLIYIVVKYWELLLKPMSGVCSAVCISTLNDPVQALR